MSPRPASASGLVRRIAATVIKGVVVFLLMWLMAFSIFTSLLTAAGCCVAVVAASAASDPVEMVLDAIAALVFGVLGAIAAFFGADIQSLRQLKGSRPRTGASLDYGITFADAASMPCRTRTVRLREKTECAPLY
jgi:hypothetical protein